MNLSKPSRLVVAEPLPAPREVPVPAAKSPEPVGKT
jgi:hypothetical protein